MSAGRMRLMLDLSVTTKLTIKIAILGKIKLTIHRTYTEFANKDYKLYGNITAMDIQTRLN